MLIAYFMIDLIKHNESLPLAVLPIKHRVYMIRPSFNYSILLLLISLVFCSCENEIQLFPEGTDSTLMVYGILDANSPNQYVKIRKTFGGNTDLAGLVGNHELSRPPDSLKVNILESLETRSYKHSLSRVDMLKEPGQFSDDENIIYQGSFWLIGTNRYDLIIDDPETGTQVTASTNAIEPPVLRFPTQGNTKYNFADTVNHFYVKYVPSGSVHLQQFYINYVEILNTGDTLFKTANFELHARFRHPARPVVTYTRTYSKDYVVNIIRYLVPEDYNVIERQLYSFDFVVWAGDEYLKDYLQLAEKFNDNRRQFFSNIEGGLGIFAACSHTSVEGIYPRQQFFDTLANSGRLKNLFFSNHRFGGEFIKSTKSIPNFKATSSEIHPEEFFER